MRGVFRTNVPRSIDVAIVLALLVGFGAWGAKYWKSVTARGQPFYYQLYFEPAVMVACGKGFVVSRPQVPEMASFLQQKVDLFSCGAIPPDAPLGTDDLFQLGSWRYLMLTVGWTWRLFGVSWRALGPLFGALFGATIAAAYTIFRLGMGPVLSVVGAVALRFSLLHLKYLPVLRDYAKAPFALALIALLGLLVVRRATWKSVPTIAVLYGAVAGIGYGFRTDFIADIPPFLLALVLFLDGGILRNLRLKAAGGILCLAAFKLLAAK